MGLPRKLRGVGLHCFDFWSHFPSPIDCFLFAFPLDASLMLLLLDCTSCSWVAKCNTASIHCNDNDKDHHAEETGGRAGETERPKTSRPPGALVSTRAPSQPRTSRVLSVAPPGPDRPAQTSPRALQGYEAGLTEASLTQSVGWQLNRRP